MRERCRDFDVGLEFDRIDCLQFWGENRKGSYHETDIEIPRSSDYQCTTVMQGRLTWLPKAPARVLDSEGESNLGKGNLR